MENNNTEEIKEGIEGLILELDKTRYALEAFGLDANKYARVISREEYEEFRVYAKRAYGYDLPYQVNELTLMGVKVMLKII